MEENKTPSQNTEQNIPKDKLPKPKKKEEPEYMSTEWFKKNMPWAYQNL